MKSLADILPRPSLWLTAIAAALAAGAAAVSCNTTGCLENRSSIPLVGLYSAENEQSIVIDSLEITGIGVSSDEPLYKVRETSSSVYLPMRSTRQSTSWQFAYKYSDIMDGRLCDTISFDYTSSPYFASEECGVIYNYHIDRLEYTTHVIERIEILDSLVSNTDVERIRIYFRTE